jgi:hypothetical protein
MSDEQFAAFIKIHPVSGGKGDNTAQRVEGSQGGFVNTLQGAFSTNNQQQQNQLNFLTQQLENQINNPQGFSPQTLAAMKTQAIQQSATENANVEQAVQAKEATQGGAGSLPSGVNAQINASVAQGSANNLSNELSNINTENGMLQNENREQALGELEGVAGLENPEGIASAEAANANSVAGLSEANTQASGPTAGSILGGVIGAGAGLLGKTKAWQNI